MQSAQRRTVENSGDRAYSSRGRGARPGAVAGLRSGLLSMLSCGRLHAGGCVADNRTGGTEVPGQSSASGRAAIIISTGVESKREEPEIRGRDGTTVVAQTERLTVGKGANIKTRRMVASGTDPACTANAGGRGRASLVPRVYRSVKTGQGLGLAPTMLCLAGVAVKHSDGPTIRRSE